MSDEMSIETRTAKSIEHTYRSNAVQRRPAWKCPRPGASLTSIGSRQTIRSIAATNRNGFGKGEKISRFVQWRPRRLRPTIIQPTSAIRARSSKAAGLHPAISPPGPSTVATRDVRQTSAPAARFAQISAIPDGVANGSNRQKAMFGD
jgi:hypothetical protein